MLSPRRASRTRRRSPVVLVAAAVAASFIALLLYGVFTKTQGSTIDAALRAGRTSPAPGFTLPFLAGENPQIMTTGLNRARRDGVVSLEELRGVPVVLNFWASWCPPCAAEAPELRAAAAAEGRRIAFLGIDVQDTPNDGRAFVREHRIPYPSARDRGNETYRKYKLTGLPETFFIDAGGRVVAHVIGQATSRQLRAGLAAALRGRPLDATGGGDRRRLR